MKKSPPRPLHPDAIVTLALDIADREGLAAVSFRRLAEELGVTAMALYHHVQDKAALLGLMTDRLLGEVRVPDDSERKSWRKSLRILLGSFVSVREKHPCAADLLQSHFSGSSQAPRLTEVALQILVQAGFDPPSALLIVQQLAALLVVRPPPAEPAARRPRVKGWSWSRSDEGRALGIELLIHGIDGLLRQQRRSRRTSRSAPGRA